MKTRIKIDSRVRPIVSLLEEIRSKPANQPVLTKDDLNNLDPILTKGSALRILEDYGLVVRQANKTLRVVRKRNSVFAEIYRDLNLLLWLITSRGYSEARVHESHQSLTEWFGYLKCNFEYLEGHRTALSALGLAKKYKSGLILNTMKRYQEPTPSSLSDRAEQILIVREERELYEPIRAFLMDNRARDEGFDYTGWSHILIADKDLANRSGPIGDWGNPDIFAYRSDENPLTGMLTTETLAIEVKKKESKRKDKWVNVHFRKAWVAQAQSYSRFSNLCYLAINTSLEKILERPIILRYMLDSKVGLLLLRDPGDLDSWWEVIPPGYHHPRPAAAQSFLAHVLKEETPASEKKSAHGA